MSVPFDEGCPATQSVHNSKVHHCWLSNRSNPAKTHLKLCVAFNHNYLGDDRRGAVSVEGSLGREWIQRTEIYLDRAGISV